MKRQFFAVIAVILSLALSVATLAGCFGSINDIPVDPGQETPNQPDNPDKPVDPNQPEEGTFVAHVVVDSGEDSDGDGKNDLTAFRPQDEELYVVWRNLAISETKTAKVNRNGNATIEGVDGNYSVGLAVLENAGTDEEHFVYMMKDYSYNPNIYFCDNDNRSVTITIVPLSKPIRGDGETIYPGLRPTEGIYEMSGMGTYRASVPGVSLDSNPLNNNNRNPNLVFYQFEPTGRGRYTIETWVSIYDNAVNPIVNIYYGSSTYKHLNAIVDEGGEASSGGFTKNVKWTIEIGSEFIGGVYAFAIRAQSRSGEFPVSIDFTVSFESDWEYEHLPRENVEAQEADRATPNESGTLQRVGTNESGTWLYRSAGYAYWPLEEGGDGYWHVYDTSRYASSQGYGPRLVVYFRVQTPFTIAESETGSLTFETLLNVQEDNPYQFGNDEATFVYDYTNFVRTYVNACNGDGVCYVTQEMKEFLQNYCIGHQLFWDGLGSIESQGAYAEEEAMWLFACAYYQ